MSTNGTLHIPRRSAEAVFHAVRYATDIGRPLNIHVTISFIALSIDDDAVPRFFAIMRERVGRWWRYQNAKGRGLGPITWVHCHANPAGSRHVDWLIHVPSEAQKDFAKSLIKCLQKLARRKDIGDGLHIQPIATPGSVAKYILRGVDPAYAEYFHLRSANEGLVMGRRTGASRSVGHTARRSAGWTRRPKS